jgi:(2Fe-2S) ferredoxin
MKTHVATAAALLLLALRAHGAALAMPSQIAAEYRLTFTGITIGHVSETYSRTGDRYAIRSVARAEGPLKLFLDDQLTLSSSGRVVASGLQPLEFEQHRASSQRGAVQATFDWDKGVMHSEEYGKRSETPLPEQTQDRISVMYQFMNIPTADATVAMHMSNGRKVELYTYRLVDEPHIATPAGEFDTLHYERVTTGARESKAQVWLAKDRFNFPVRVVFDDPKGLRVEQTLVGLTAR